MKVSELIEHLAKLPQDMEVLIPDDGSGDAEPLFYTPSVSWAQEPDSGRWWGLIADEDVSDDPDNDYYESDKYSACNLKQVVVVG